MFEFNKETEFILGRPNFWCASLIVPILRAKGQDVPTHAEEEQAASIYYMLEMYEQHGDNWREEIGKQAKELKNQRIANK